jgi:UDP-2,3-diacylglucosamine pyrophosphatase LpxH
MPGTDLLIYGHSHVPHLERGAHGVYANAGTWMDDTTYLTIREDAVRLHRWSPDDPEAELSVVSRSPVVKATTGR